MPQHPATALSMVGYELHVHTQDWTNRSHILTRLLHSSVELPSGSARAILKADYHIDQPSISYTDFSRLPY